MIRFHLLGAVLLLAHAAAEAAPHTALRDPFLRPAAARLTPPTDSASSAEPAPRLRALVLGGARSLANIDGHVVATGEQFAGYTVLRIDANGVLLARAGRELRLTMQDKDPQ